MYVPRTGAFDAGMDVHGAKDQPWRAEEAPLYGALITTNVMVSESHYSVRCLKQPVACTRGQLSGNDGPLSRTMGDFQGTMGYFRVW